MPNGKKIEDVDVSTSCDEISQFYLGHHMGSSPNVSATPSIRSVSSSGSIESIADSISRVFEGFNKQPSVRSRFKDVSSIPQKNDSNLSKNKVNSRSIDGLINLATGIMGQLTQDFSVMQPAKEDECEVLQPEKNLSVKYTTNMLSRFDDNYYMMLGICQAVLSEYYKLTLWVRPFQSFLVFVALLYSIWNEYLLTVILGGQVLALTYTFLLSRGFMDSNEFYESLDGLKRRRRNKANKLTHFMSNINGCILSAGTVFNAVCDHFEKLACLWTWQKAWVTLVIYGLCVVGTILSLVIPAGVAFKISMTAVVLKLFVADFIFSRFPIVRSKYDPVYLFWNYLPTAEELNQEEKNEKRRRRQIHNNHTTSPAQGNSEDWIAAAFGIPQSEKIRPSWQQGVECTMLNRVSAGVPTLKNGRLMLSTNYLLFMRSKSQPAKNTTISIKNIVSVQKGSSVSAVANDLTENCSTIVITTQEDKQYIFTAIPNFDRVYSELHALVPLSLD